MINTVLLAGIAMTSLNGMIQPTQSPPPCIETPKGLTDAQKKCYDDACNKFHTDWAACDNPTCRTVAELQYFIDFSACIPALAFSDFINNTNDWIILRYENGVCGHMCYQT